MTIVDSSQPQSHSNPKGTKLMNQNDNLNTAADAITNTVVDAIENKSAEIKKATLRRRVRNAVKIGASVVTIGATFGAAFYLLRRGTASAVAGTVAEAATAAAALVRR